MSSWELPTSAEINGREYEVRSDFRAALDVITIMSDPDLDERERALLALVVFYPEFEDMGRADLEPALDWLRWFIDGGEQRDPGSSGPRLMDWDQDFPLVVAPVNRVLGFESRSCEYLHWWTFLSAYMEIGDCMFANVVAIRRKKARGKKLDKADRDFYKRNRKLVDMRARVSASDEEVLEEWIT